jgi:hypothetical protein
MANTNVFTGMDGSITIAVDDAESPEGQAATAVSDAFGLAPIGRATDVSVSVTSAMRPFHEIGQRYATELRPGNVNVEGSMGRAHINGALLRLMLGDRQPDVQPQPAAREPGQAGAALDPDRPRRQDRRLELPDARGRLHPRVGVVQGAVDRGRGRQRRRGVTRGRTVR